MIITHTLEVLGQKETVNGLTHIGQLTIYIAAGDDFREVQLRFEYEEKSRRFITHGHFHDLINFRDLETEIRDYLKQRDDSSLKDFRIDEHGLVAVPF